MEFVGLILLAIAIPIAWTVGFFIAIANSKRVLRLETRLEALERGLVLLATPAPAAAPRAAPAPAAPTPSAAAEPPPTAQPVPPAAAAKAAAPETPRQTAAPASVPPIPPSSAAPAISSAPSGPGLEERLGTKWVVWVGGIALALGAIFLVHYSIEQGLIGPGLRIILGALFAAALVAGGEWARRKESRSGLPGLPQASIPAILTAAGTTAAFATVWAAHGLYGFLAPGTAFILLGLVALATLAAALLHGPALAGLGLVGAFVAPALIDSPEPNYWALYLYLAVVTAAAFALARMRLWRWLALTAIGFGFGWLLLGLGAPASSGPEVFFVLAGFTLAAALIVGGLFYGPDLPPETLDEVSAIAVGAYVAEAAILAIATRHDPAALIAFTLLAAATVAITWRTASAAVALPGAALLSALVIAEWAVRVRAPELIAPAGATAAAFPDPGSADVGMHLALGAALAALFGVSGFLAQGRYARALVPMLWAVSALVAPIAILVALYYRIAGFERSIPFAALALLLAALYATATELLSKREPRPGQAAAEALFAVGAIAGLALALTFALEQGWLTVALALMAPGIAMIAQKRPLPMLRWMAAGAAALVCARVVYEPQIVTNLGTTPIFNWLLWGYGVPALCFWVAGYLLRQRADDVPARMLDSAAILFTVLTVTLEIRHTVGGGNIYARNSGLAELGLQASTFLAMAIGLERLRGRTHSPVHNVGAVLIAAAALLVIVFGLLLAENPLGNNQPVGGRFFNLILLGYGLPAVLAVTLALIAKQTRPMPYRAVAAGAAVVLSIMYLTLEVRRLYQGPVIGLFGHPPGDAELWTYSAVWLGFGVLLLLVGILLRSQPARLASAAVILLTVVKVFVYDLAGIGGIWRSLSFIGLGLVLVGIGWLYQRLLFPPRPQAVAPIAAAAPT